MTYHRVIRQRRFNVIGLIVCVIVLVFVAILAPANLKQVWRGFGWGLGREAAQVLIYR